MERMKKIFLDTARKWWRKNPQKITWYIEVIVTLQSKDAAWEDVLGAREEIMKETRMDFMKPKGGRLRDVSSEQKKDIYEQFGRKKRQ